MDGAVPLRRRLLGTVCFRPVSKKKESGRANKEHDANHFWEGERRWTKKTATKNNRDKELNKKWSRNGDVFILVDD